MKQLPINYNGWFLLPGYFMNVFGTIYVSLKTYVKYVSDKVMNHEGIHVCQVEDIAKKLHIPMWLAYTIFYILYGIEWIIKGIISIGTLFRVRAYRSISFEQEAHNNDDDLKYQYDRRSNCWTKYILKLVWK